jgi:hypothetical protein
LYYSTTMPHRPDPDELKIPAFLRKKAIVTQARQRLILTALDRKEARLKPNSKKALAPVRKPVVPQKLRPLPRVETRAPLGTNKKIKKVGTVTHYFSKIDVIVIALRGHLQQGDFLLIEGENELFFQEIKEMQIDRQAVTKAGPGKEIGLKIEFPGVKIEGSVYKVTKTS